MPRGDRTGPAGMGPRTGRGMGYCSGFAAPGFMNGGAGFGAGFGGGRGRGFRRMYFQNGTPGWGRFSGYPYGYQPYAVPMAAQDERELLQNQIAFLEKQLEQAREQLNQMTEAE